MISLHTLTEMQNALGCKQALHCGMPLTFLYVYTKNTGISVYRVQNTYRNFV